nr:MAG TPA: hypothetical protein [Bacteriophage sp.]
MYSVLINSLYMFFYYQPFQRIYQLGLLHLPNQ